MQLIKNVENRAKRMWGIHQTSAEPSASRSKVESIGATVCKGLVAGTVGAAAMTLAEKIEQSFTGRPNSYVPAHTLERMLRLQNKPDSQRFWLNHVMHWGQGALLGVIRAAMARSGLQGAMPSFAFTGMRLFNDQVFENITRVGAPPWTWPKNEQRIDLFHKSVYGFVTGYVADSMFADPIRRRHDS